MRAAASKGIEAPTLKWIEIFRPVCKLSHSGYNVQGYVDDLVVVVSNEDLTVVSREAGGSISWWASVYLPFDFQGELPPENLKDMVEKAQSPRTSLIIGSDANAHHVIWGSSDTNMRASYFNGVVAKEDTSFVEAFFKNDEITTIGATMENGRIIFHHKIPTGQVCLVFYKIPHLQTSINQSDNGCDVQLGMLTLEGGMVKSMYNSVSRIFSPHVGAKNRNEYGPELYGLLQNLQTSLNSTLGLPESGITSVQDEMNYWNQKIINASTKYDREQAQTFAEMLEKLNEQLNKIDQNNISSIEEFLDIAHGSLDEIWKLKYHYPQNRMGDLMDVICNFIIEICTEILLLENIWSLSSYHVNNLMSQAMDITDSWLQLCDTLTRLFWPNYIQHQWLGDPHIPKRGKQFKERLTEIRNIKNLYKQIVTLINIQEIRDLLSHNSAFKSVHIFDISSIGQMKWNKALNYFEQMLQPVDERIAMAIKGELQIHLNNPKQMMYIFQKYDTLIRRPTVMELLIPEREQFLQSLTAFIHDLRKTMNDINVEPNSSPLSTLCNECRWLKIIQYQVSEIDIVSHLISGRDGFDRANQLVQELKEEVDSLLRTNFEIWSEQCSSGIKNGKLRLHEDQPVVKFESEGRQLMEVTFNPELITLCADVREFQNLGYTIPIELRVVADHASKFISYARRLQQIATFHNTIGDRMIPCQRPIMLQNAVEFSSLVKSESVAWNDEESVERYVSTLQSAVTKLSADNTLLVGYHEQAKRIVIKLMNTDLLNEIQTWKEEMKHLRELVANLERQGYTNLEAFNLHWDHQLYKVLEYQYIMGLIDMNNKLPDIKIDIIFRQRQLQFRPCEEEIRAKYYTELRRFIERPLGFRGLSENSSDLFKVMVERNRHYLGPLYQKANELFEKLNELKTLWLPLVSLGCVDIDQLCTVHLNKWEDWDTNFKACKYFSQQIAKLQSTEEVIDCFVVNVVPLQSDIEFINRRYWESLANSLRISILNDISEIQEFLQSSLKFLQNVPMHGALIAESGARYEKIVAEYPKISTVLERVKGKDTCLAGWCKERVSALSNILNQWEKLQPLIENHSVVLQRQVDIMKDHIKTKIFNMTNEVEKFMLRWESSVTELENMDEINLDLFKDRQENWKLIKEQFEKLEDECKKFNVDIPDEIAKNFQQNEETINNQAKQWQIYDEFSTELENIIKEEWTIYRRRPYIFTEFLSKWESSINSSLDLPSSRIRRKVQHYQEILPILQYLQSDSLTERHWARIFQLLNKDIKPMHTITLKDVLDSSILLEQNSTEIQNLIRKASSEQVVRQALNELDQWAVTANFKLILHSDSSRNDISLIKDYQDILNKIGDNQSLLQSAKNSAAFDSFSDQAEIWEGRLNTLESLLTSLSQSQRKWIYLEPVFATGTLKSEEAIFKRLDKDFRYVMKEIQLDPRVTSLLKISNVTAVIKSLENQLSRCQSTLMSYIMEKRNSFPRFYFLGDDDLLELLGQASKEEIIQKHIKKLFPGIHSLCITKKDGAPNVIDGIKSSEGDNIQLKEKISMTTAIESWLNQLINSIQTTLKEQIQICCDKSPSPFTEEFMNKYPVQVLSTTRAILFTKQTEKAIMSMSLNNSLKSLKEEVTKLVQIKNTTKIRLVHLKAKDILLDLVHYINIVEELKNKNVTNLNDWEWLQQLKFYLEKNGQVRIKMVYSEFDYSYEYLGNSNKLVNTKLTHRCYLTLTQAMQMGLGGNPFGPAGTGKTECVKALGATMGRLVLVFNCDENVDTEAMKLILTGLALCGAWGCFDEFNRLQEATLSAISMIIQPIQMALKDKSDFVQISDKNIKLNQHAGIFVTLNPAGEGYGGRQQLPGNIKALFRPIVMQKPEPKEIAQILLFVEGFQNSNEIGNRIVELFDMCPKILSSQLHYDWGLRELKTVLLACGKNYRELTTNSPEVELQTVAQVLRTNTMSKLNSIDAKRFDMLLRLTFPEVQTDNNQISVFKDVIENCFAELKLYKNGKQLEKCIQLYEQLTKRMGVVVIGPPCSGKTTIITLLKHALKKQGKQIRYYIISPKSMNRIQLLGKLDPDTRQWNDGVLTTTAIAVNSEPETINSWIICDGDVDPEWIEALNSVLDDNRLLTLPSGWRIQFGNNVNFIFETHDLSHASPATISRMGIVNLSADDLPEKAIIETFLENEEYSDIIRSYTEEYLEKSIQFLQPYSQKLFAGWKFCVLKSILENLSGAHIKEDFCVRLVQTILGFIKSEFHNELANKIYEALDIYIPDSSRVELAFFNESRNSIDFFETDSRNAPQSDLIQTSQTKLYLSAIRRFLTTFTPFLMVGSSGSGKTLLIQHAVAEMSGFQLVIINCSKQLTPSYVLHILKQNTVMITGAKGRECKPQQSKLILFFKNIDLCYIDSWGTNSVVQLLLQIYQRGGFYSETLEWILVNGLQICGSVSDLTVAKNKLSPRFLALQNYLTVKYPIEEDLQVILTNQIEPLLANFKNPPNLKGIVECLMRFFKEVIETFSQDRRVHYSFTPKMIVKMLECLKFYSENYFIEALVTEINSKFRNRLVSVEELDEYDQILQSNMRPFLKNNNENLYFVAKPQFSSILCLKHEEWSEDIRKSVDICNTETYEIRSAITMELLKLCSLFSRILVRPNINLVIISQEGSRCIDALYLTSTIVSSKVLSLNGTKNYSMLDFYNDLKLAMQQAATEDQLTILLIDHIWITYLPEIMNPLEAILEGSEILDLFGEDLESIASPLKSSAQLEGYQESLASYFLKRVKNNLRVVISLNSDSENIEKLFINYPALYRSTEQLWIQQPTPETYIMLPKSNLEILTNSKHEIPIPINYFKAVVQIHSNLAPIRYYHLIEAFYYIFKNFNHDIKEKLERLKAGVEKLAAAHQVVAKLKADASVQEEALAEKRKLANDALEMISTTMRNANDQKTDLLEIKRKTQESSIKLKQRQEEIAAELSEVEPILREASAAVGQIKTEALSEIRSLRAPPETIRDILEGVLRLMGTRDTSWNSMKSFLAKRGVKEDIKSLDPSRISPENCEAVEKLLENKSESFEMRNAKRASAAAAPLAAWVIANVKYSKVIQSIKPLEQEQRGLKKSLVAAENQMESLKSGLDDVDARVKELSQQLNIYTQEAAVLEIKLEEARNTLKASEVLVQKLSSEYHTWNMQFEEHTKEQKTLDLKSFWVSYDINYTSHLSIDESKRMKEILAKECNSSESFELARNLITEQDQVIWESMGLSKDAQAIENAVLLSKILELPYGSCPVPILLDPSETTLKWLREYLSSKEKSFEFVSQNLEKISYTIELAIRFGKILVIHDLEEILPPLLQLINCRIFSKFNKKNLQVGMKFVDYHEDFRLILVSKLDKIHLNPELETLITKIHFTITKNGLTDELLSKKITFKKPEIEERRINLLKNEGKLLKERANLEKKLLAELNSAQGDILKNEKLLKALNEIKEKGANIDQSLRESSEVKIALLEEYNQYRDFCLKTATFYINASSVYDISVSAFLKIYLKTLKVSGDIEDAKIYKYLIKTTYQYICRSHPKNTHIAIGLQICKDAYPEAVPTIEWELFVTNFISSEESTDNTNLPIWVTKEQKSKIQVFRTQLPELINKLQFDNDSDWKRFLNRSDYNDHPFLNGTVFQKLLATQIFRPDFLLLAMSETIIALIGIKPDSIQQPTIDTLIDDSSVSRPVLMITEAGNDPSNTIKEFALTKYGKGSYGEFSIGSLTENEMIDRIKRASIAGHWICLKNAHLKPNLITRIDREIALVAKNADNKFRLWIMTDSIKDFPEIILYKYVRVLYESPNGLKMKVQRSMQKWDYSSLNNNIRMMKLHVVFFILNAVLQERLKYIPQGWSKWYEIGDAETSAALNVLKWISSNNSNNLSKIDWNILRGLTDVIAFGGRIDNINDLQILCKHLELFFTDKIMENRWSPLQLKFQIPNSIRIQDYEEMLDRFKDRDDPEDFGLSPISDVFRNISFCKEILHNLRNSYFKKKGERTETYEKRIKPILGLWKKLASNISIDQTFESIGNTENTSTTSWQNFLYSEMKIARALYKNIHSTLVQVHSIIRKPNEAACDQNIKILAENKVLRKWRKIWPTGPKSTTDFLRAVILRIKETEKRFKINFDIEFCEEIDLSTIFNASALLAALKLTVSSRLGVSCCNLILKSSTSDLNRNGNSMIVVKLAPVQIDGATFSSDSEDINNVTGYVNLPLYANIYRDSHICNLNLPSNNDIDSVLLSGSALYVPDIQQ
ncbi:cytoplasmic dynein 2 heavy chain 1 [Condylostylus longicornis]|uniref:cytoplasmic dynein 2 heavy chain 1 n=1 Tax=Condylostylus longicornis TaxID=2530218 RepID=UPI00244DB490|nr:cytoplasmic dynein 2 heavy chain 1 [Condylostylus longicornis]